MVCDLYHTFDSRSALPIMHKVTRIMSIVVWCGTVLKKHPCESTPVSPGINPVTRLQAYS